MSSSKVIVNDYEIPSWAGKPPIGLHLDVMKEGKLIQKLMIDERKYYFFGRNKEANDFQIDHASCSRVHAVLIWHKHLSRPFLVDLGSTHGTFIGNVRLEPHKPQQVFIDSVLKFGASLRCYVVREKPQQTKTTLNQSEDNTEKEYENHMNNLPQSEAELDNLTEFNTAHNKRIAQIVDISETNISSIMPTVKKKRKGVSFNEEEQIINPEDVDPSIGRFRNLIQATIVIPNKKRPIDMNKQMNNQDRNYQMSDAKKLRNDLLYDPDEDSIDDNKMMNINSMHSFDIASKLGIKLPDLAPSIEVKSDEFYNKMKATESNKNIIQDDQESSLYEPRKKKYAKEAWPGRNPNVPGGANASNASALSSSFNLF